MRFRNHEPHRRARYLSLGIFFAVCCVIFAARLVFYQLAVPEAYARPVSADGNIRTVTVAAQRGNICDRNGTVLVTNSYTYDMRLEFGALPDSRDGIHRVFLSALEAITATGAERAQTYNFFDGAYTVCDYSAEALDESSTTHRKLLLILKTHYVSTKKFGSAEEALSGVTASELVRSIAVYYDIITRAVWGATAL